MRDDRAYIAHLQGEVQMLRQLLQFIAETGASAEALERVRAYNAALSARGET